MWTPEATATKWFSPSLIWVGFQCSARPGCLPKSSWLCSVTHCPQVCLCDSPVLLPRGVTHSFPLADTCPSTRRARSPGLPPAALSSHWSSVETEKVVWGGRAACAGPRSVQVSCTCSRDNARSTVNPRGHRV